MLLIREIMYCKPGKVRAMVDKSLAMAKLSEHEKLMEGYHDLVDYGRREIYKIEG